MVIEAATLPGCELGDGLVYADQHAAALRLVVLEAAIPDGPFQVVRERCVERAGVRFRACVIGQSHFWTLEVAGRFVSEVLACFAPASLAGVVGRWPVDAAELGPGIAREIGGLRYDARCEVLACDDAAVTGSPEALASPDAVCGQLHYVFPQRDDGSPPATWLGYALDVARGRLAVETRHVYPNDQTVVVSRSRLTWPPATA